MRFRHLLTGLAVAVAVLLASPPSSGIAAPGDISCALPRGGGIGLVVWGGGAVDGLRAAFTVAWVSSPSGKFIGYVNGAPTVVNAAFTAAYPQGLPPVTPLIILCASSPPPQTPVPSAAGTGAPSAAGRLSQLQVAEPASGIPRYDRAGWPLWIDEDHDCQDARQEVLIAESWTPVTFETSANCRVGTGEWHDPYTGAVLTDPSGLDIDHLVPLENSYVSGG